MKYNVLRWLLVLGFLVVSFTPTNAQNNNTTAFDMDGPHVLLPQTVAASSQERIDFVLYYFTTGEADEKRQILFAYVGYYPSFPKDVPKNAKESRAKINERPAKTFLWEDKDNRLCRETLVDTGNKIVKTSKGFFTGTIPKKVHFVYRGLTQNEAKTADAIIATLKPFPEPSTHKPAVQAPTKTSGN